MDCVQDTVFAAHAAATSNVVAKIKFNRKQPLEMSMGVHYMLVLCPQVWRQNGEMVDEGECRLGAFGASESCYTTMYTTTAIHINYT